MSISYLIVDDRLRDVRCTRQRCAASLRAALERLSKLQVGCAPQDRKAALEREQQVIAEALEKLLVPAVQLQAPLSKVDREIEHVVALSLRDAPMPVLRERNRSHRLPDQQGVAAPPAPPPPPPEPEWEEEPAVAATPPVEAEPGPEPLLDRSAPSSSAEPLWRVNLNRRRLAAAGAR